MTNDPPEDSTDRLHQIPLRLVLGVVAIASAFLALTRTSVAASVLVLMGLLLALGCIFMGENRGQLVVLLMIVVPLLVLGIGYALVLLVN